MAKKTYRSIYIDEELDRDLVDYAEVNDTSASRLVRLAILDYLKKMRDVNEKTIMNAN